MEKQSLRKTKASMQGRGSSVVSQFVAVTGADESTAKYYLEANGYDLEVRPLPRTLLCLAPHLFSIFLDQYYSLYPWQKATVLFFDSGGVRSPPPPIKPYRSFQSCPPPRGGSSNLRRWVMMQAAVAPPTSGAGGAGEKGPGRRDGGEERGTRV